MTGELISNNNNNNNAYMFKTNDEIIIKKEFKMNPRTLK